MAVLLLVAVVIGLGVARARTEAERRRKRLDDLTGRFGFDAAQRIVNHDVWRGQTVRCWSS